MNLHYISEHYKGYEITVEQNSDINALVCLYKDEILVFNKEKITTLKQMFYWRKFYMSYIDNYKNTGNT